VEAADAVTVRLVLRAASLLAVALPARAQDPAMPTVALNHFYLSVDSATYADIAGSAFLRSTFAPFERRTTVRADRTYTGIYFYGTHTYFEFFDASAQRDLPLHQSGLAFAVEEPGTIQTLRERLGTGTLGPITRGFEGRQVPWFAMLDLESALPESVVDPWVMEYDPRFLAEWHPELGGERGIDRATVLRRYVRALAEVPTRPLLQDVTGLTIAVDARTTDGLRRLTRGFGWRTEARADTTTLAGPDVVLRLVPESNDVRGIVRVELAVQRDTSAPAELRFGARSVLRFGGGRTAVWSF
jgi:hypothetical protein